MDIKYGKTIVEDLNRLKPFPGMAFVLRDPPEETYVKGGKLIIPEKNRDLDAPEYFVGTIIALGEPRFSYRDLNNVKEWHIKVGERVFFQSWGRGGELDVEILSKDKKTKTLERLAVCMYHEMLAVVED